MSLGPVRRSELNSKPTVVYRAPKACKRSSAILRRIHVKSKSPHRALPSFSYLPMRILNRIRRRQRRLRRRLWQKKWTRLPLIHPFWPPRMDIRGILGICRVQVRRMGEWGGLRCLVRSRCLLCFPVRSWLFGGDLYEPFNYRERGFFFMLSWMHLY